MFVQISLNKVKNANIDLSFLTSKTEIEHQRKQW
ncbi:hypothetical protein T479_07465 [Lysinibacillus varians]|nr:hypothetical protein T479_07465 [Lysinibacillus varians]